jgi:phage anti-repressor protein
MSKPERQTRGDRWMEAAQTAADALSTLLDIQEEYQEWYDNMPEQLQSGATGEKLSAICDLDIESAQSTAQEAADADLPLGFGRD